VFSVASRLIAPALLAKQCMSQKTGSDYFEDQTNLFEVALATDYNAELVA
jgi:hypothetical protein